MYYVVQQDLFKKDRYFVLLEVFKKLKLDHELVKFVPFVADIEFVTNRKDVFVFGSANMARAASKYKWVPGSMCNANHDFEVYAKYYGEYMLNYDGVVMEFTDPVPGNFPFIFFARPTKDTKVFSGQLFTADSWKEYVEECISEKMASRVKKETKVLLAPVKSTEQEVRCWIVDGKVVTASRYKLGERTLTENYDDEDHFVQFALKMADIYQPAKAFVMDVCLSGGQYKIVEINCINCSGLYEANMWKLVNALEAAFSDTGS
jgi:hypothetical protein